jgi:hypothetical protein
MLFAPKPKARDCDAKGCEFFRRTWDFGRRGVRGFGQISVCMCTHWGNPGKRGLVSENDVCPKELE